MADKHPYVTGPGGLIKVLNHFKKSFPSSVTAETLKKLNYAPNNETYVLNVLRFLKIINDDGNKDPGAAKDFNLHDYAAFQAAFAKRVESSYKDLFELHSAATWTISSDSLISFFRQTDGTTDLVGKKQASTFKTLASFCGHGEAASPKAVVPKKAVLKASPSSRRVSQPKTIAPAVIVGSAAPAEGKAIGLTVRIEINLPADGDQATYDHIFKSIRQNLLND